MLVLTRYKGQSIFIGDDITVTVLAGNGNGNIRLGINAPRHIKVLRDELAPYQAIDEKTTENSSV